MDKNKIAVYIKPFDASGNYVDDWIDVTNDTLSIGNISEGIDSSDYQIGVYKNSNVSISLNNSQGKYSDVDITTSIFLYKRNDSRVKITYNLHLFEPLLGLVNCGEFYLSEEVTIFEGLLSDESYRFNAKDERANFIVLGYESLFSRQDVDYSSIAGTENNEQLLLQFLNQTVITNILTVSGANIDCGLNQVPDDFTKFENKTVREGLDILLMASNSVLYIKDSIIYIAPRTESSELKYTFYGQGSSSGFENIISINQYNKGFHRMFNYFSWKDASIKEYDSDSINLYGVRKKELDLDIYTDTTKRENILTELLSEYKDPKIELELITFLEYNILSLDLLDKIVIDYPIPYVATTDEPLPICGVAICGTAVLPKGLWSLYISNSKYFKILSKNYNTKNLEVTFKLREV